MTCDDAAAWVLHRTRHFIVALEPEPYNSGHVTVSPLRHLSSLEELAEPDLLELARLSRLAIRAIRRAYAPHGFNVGHNEGAAGGSEPGGHLHVDVIPRWRSDTGFIASIAETRILPQGLADSYEALRGGFD